MTYTRPAHGDPTNDGSATDATIVIDALSDGLEALEAGRIGGIGLHPPVLAQVTSAATGAGPRFTDKVGDLAYGVVIATGAIHTSPDGVTWTEVNATWPGASGAISRIIATSDGEMLAMNDTELRKSSGWATNPATATWSASKVTPNGTCVFVGFGLDGDGTKFIVAQYNATPADWDQSRYVHISTNSGTTWTMRYDSETLHGATASNLSHLHGTCYDPWSDRFYVCEGHDTAGGVYSSDDDGVTWSATPMLVESSTGETNAPTVIVATDDGLVLGSDNGANGLFGVLRKTLASDEKIVRTWALRTGRDGVICFAQRGWRDPSTGFVFVTFRSEFSDTPIIVAAGTPSSGGLVYEDPTTPTTGGADRFYSFAKFGTDDALFYGEIGGVAQHFYGTLTRPGDDPISVRQDGNVLDGKTGGWATSVAVGRAVSDSTNSTSMGQGAASVGADNTIIGHIASGTASAATAVGKSAVAANAGTSVGRGAVTVLAGVSVGYGATTSGAGNGVALGALAEAVGTSVALGYAADASGFSGSVALGTGVVTTSAAQVRVGAQHLELDEVTAPAAPAANGARLYVEDNGGGKTRLVVKFATGAAIVLATEA